MSNKAMRPFNTDLTIKDIDKAEVVLNFEDMCVNGFYIVGTSVANGKVLFYSKGSGVNLDKYPKGVFFKTDGDPTFYDAAEIFAAPNLSVWCFWPDKIVLRGDPR